MQDIKQKWDRIYAAKDSSIRPEPCYVLKCYEYLLPAKGYALDLASGLGGNAIYLAQQGLHATAVDISSVAIKQIIDQNDELVKAGMLTARCQAIDANNIEQSRYDVIVVSNFLDRELCASLVSALLPGGVLFYQTFSLQKANPDCGPSNPLFLLQKNELLTLFGELRILAYSDLGAVGNVDKGYRNQSYLVAQRKEL